MLRIFNFLLLCFVSTCAIAEPIQWTSCSQEAHGTVMADGLCTHLALPNQPAAQLNVLKLPAYSDKKAAPIVIITGGPGTAAVSLANSYRYWFHKAQKEHDLLFIDQRGTGKSQPFNCQQADENDFYQDSAIQLKKHHKNIIACIDEYSTRFDLKDISTVQAARDLDFVRQQLGYEQLLLWSNSYGTRVALAYQTLFPTNIKGSVLDGVAPFEIALPSQAQADAEAALNKLFDYCDAADNCPSEFKPLKSRWLAALTALNEAEKNGRPLTIHPKGALLESTPVIKLEPAVVANWVRFILYNRELTELLPLAVYQASQSNFMPLFNIAKVASESSGVEVNAAMHAVILCREDHYAKENLLSTAGTLLPFGPLADLTPVCEYVTKQVDPAERPAISGINPNDKTPTLLLSGELDPITPSHWAELVKQSIPSAHHWIVAGGHHGVTPQGCVNQLVNQFFIQEIFPDDAEVNKCLQSQRISAPFRDFSGPKLKETQSEQAND